MRTLRRFGNVLDSRFRGNDASPVSSRKLSDGGLEQVVIRATKDGTHPASIWVDWDSVEGAVYEIQWFTAGLRPPPSDAPLTQMIGSATVTASELEVQGLVRGNQYWFRVRAVRASQPGPWSDQATRVANI